MLDSLRRVIDDDRRIAFALLFGSEAKGAAHAHSDVDVAVGLVAGEQLDTLARGALASRLETAVGRPVDLVMLDDAPPGLAYRIFRDGRLISGRDAAALKNRLARAILEYLDFKPIEDQLTAGVLRARHGR
jgi:predicted nucleotidyltransferase